LFGCYSPSDRFELFPQELAYHNKKFGRFFYPQIQRLLYFPEYNCIEVQTTLIIITLFSSKIKLNNYGIMVDG